jgi:TPR repeat protein
MRGKTLPSVALLYGLLSAPLCLAGAWRGVNAQAANPVPAPPKLSVQNQDEMEKRADAAYAGKDYATAAPLYRQLTDSGRTGDMNRLGYMYQFGLGLTQNYAQALVWYRKAANGGNPSAMYNLGVLYENGHGVARDDAQAVAWYRQAAEKGDASARDMPQALAWYRKAAALGNESAKANLKKLGQ